MEILRNLEVPTGNILIVGGLNGKLECLSLGDYGKSVNLNQHKKVEHTALIPLSEKWVVTISTQYGCSMGCSFCDVPMVGPGINATYDDLVNQVKAALLLHPDIKKTDRLNIHFARMGEPTWNMSVLRAALAFHDELQNLIGNSVIHPVVSTMLPRRNAHLHAFLSMWMSIKNIAYKGDAGLQLSINSTDDRERYTMFNGNALTLDDASMLAGLLPKPEGRKITLNFAVANYQIDAVKLAKLFSPDKFIVKLTPMHKTTTAVSNNIQTSGDYTDYYPYEEHEYNLKKAGFDVLTFIASVEEDLGRITCGNAILSGTEPLCEYKEVYK